MRVKSSVFFLFVSLIAAQQAPAPQAANPQDAEKQFASVEGKLVDASTGEPVRRANLVLMQMPSSGGAIMTGPPPSTAASSDSEGKFSFSKIEPGRYMLSAEKAGYVRQQYGARPGQFGPGANLALEAGQKILNLEFKLLPQAVISGKVLDEHGEPVANTMVSVLRQMPFARQPVSMMGMGTNDVGEFRIANLAPGKYLIRAEHRLMFGAVQPAAAASSKGEGTMGYVPTYYPGVMDPASAAPIAVAAGQQLSGIDIRLQKARVFQVSGKIQGAPSGTRLQVSLQPQRAGGGMFMTHFGGGATAKPDGSFVLPSVQPGTYDAVAMSFESGRPQVLGRTPVTVANGDVENIVIRAGTQLELTGRVIVEAEGDTKPAGQVMLHSAQRGPSFTPPARIQDDGTFKISGVSRDKMFVQIMGLPAGLYVKSVRAGDTDVTDSGLDLSNTDAAPALEVRVSSKSATVEGIVRDGDKPAPGSVVLLLPHPFLPELPITLRKTAPTDQNGRFSITGIAPGEYRLYAWNSYLPMNDLDPEQLKPLEKFAATVKLKEQAREQVELKVVAVEQ